MTISLQERLLSRVERIPEAGCWIWLGATIPDGYGSINTKEGTTLTHRLSWIAHKGPLESFEHVLHRCDVPSCINPDHLFLGSRSDNMRDMAKKRRSPIYKLSQEDVQEIRSKRDSGVTLARIAKEFAVSEATVSRTARAVIWRGE